MVRILEQRIFINILQCSDKKVDVWKIVPRLLSRAIRDLCEYFAQAIKYSQNRITTQNLDSSKTRFDLVFCSPVFNKHTPYKNTKDQKAQATECVLILSSLFVIFDGYTLVESWTATFQVQSRFRKT